ncbi:MAG: 3-hydroxybutyryl-CoA dehydrogenase [Abditibacteriales bacterium]|nr:3-hydroxybutyryl-CoA dehydrogenase [Abditibacteriales bacterium]MDW8364707.1 3-hydroxybutyryl-CoA dehydrogenase [Abditibacteriales bacterium]
MSITTLAVIGAGTMGHGIAQVAAAHGLNVLLHDVSLDLIHAARERIRRGLERMAEKGKVVNVELALGRITAATQVEDVSLADFVIEAVVENAEVKGDLFRRLDAVCRPHVILASNTSSISITRLAAATQRPDKVIGLHFFNPVPVMSLVEVIRGMQTSDATLRTTITLAETLGKTPVEVKDTPGFIANRMLLPFINEACYALMEGVASAENIDKVAQLGFNHPMGPLALADLIGLDVCLAILEVLHRELGEDKYRPCPLLRKYVEAGWLGRKTGKGFYSYREQ